MTLIRFIKEEDGGGAIEYGLVATMISIAIIGGASSLGININGTFGSLSTRITTVANR